MRESSKYGHFNGTTSVAERLRIWKLVTLSIPLIRQNSARLVVALYFPTRCENENNSVPYGYAVPSFVHTARRRLF